MTHRLERTQTIRRPLPEVFAFFADAENLEAITPDFLHFRILTPRPIELRAGTLLDYELRLHGIPVRWRTRIETFEPNREFTDVQLRGPYRRWHHTHSFREVAGGTEMTDVVEYELPLGPLGSIAHALFVHRSLKRIFDYRRDRIDQMLGIGAGATRIKPSRRPPIE
ncbi:MAG: SRPBCC family protein [Planctomycetes bacterium]|nr:SRPBCC family protein [Planctomycetota bacterium]